MAYDLLLAIWFILPAALANAAPVFAARIPGLTKLDARLDFSAQFRGKDVFGDHKTWRGLIAGMILATIVLLVQNYLVHHVEWARDIVRGNDYSYLPFFILGPLLGLGALGGDAIESFFKRQRGIPSGHAWTPFDQLDYIVGTILVTLPFVQFTLFQYGWMIAVWFVLHIASTYTAWRMGLKQSPI